MKLLRITALTLFLAFSGIVLTGCAARAVYVSSPPPAARHEVRPGKPFPHAFWIPGHWVWRGNKYVWKSGYWAKPVRGKKWFAGHWSKTPRGYVWIKGHWG